MIAMWRVLASRFEDKLELALDLGRRRRRARAHNSKLAYSSRPISIVIDISIIEIRRRERWQPDSKSTSIATVVGVKS